MTTGECEHGVTKCSVCADKLQAGEWYDPEKIPAPRDEEFLADISEHGTALVRYRKNAQDGEFWEGDYFTHDIDALLSWSPITRPPSEW